MTAAAPSPLALIGDQGMLAQMVRRLAPETFRVQGFDLPAYDLSEPTSLLDALRELRPAVIVNCAAFTQVDACETQQELAFRVNGQGPGILAAAARELNARLVHISTDYVFDGTAQSPYCETDPTAPQSVYGRSKLMGERAIAEVGWEHFYLLRTSWLYGPGGRNFVETMVRLAREREELRVVADQVGSPTYTGDLAKAIFNLLGEASGKGPAEFGLYHFADQGSCSWHRFAEEILTLAREQGEPVKTRKVVPIATGDYPLPAPRPAYSVLSQDKYRQATGARVPAWQESLAHYFKYDRS